MRNISNILLIIAIILFSWFALSASAETSGDLVLEVKQAKSIYCKCDYEKTKKYPNKNRIFYKEMAEKYFVYAIMSSNAGNEEQYLVPDWEKIATINGEKGFYAQVYESENKEKIVVAIQGSKDKEDWETNFGLCNNGQYSFVNDEFKELTKSHQGQTIELTGHSLGGGLALKVALTQNSVDAIVFNTSAKVCVKKKTGIQPLISQLFLKAVKETEYCEKYTDQSLTYMITIIARTI